MGALENFLTERTNLGNTEPRVGELRQRSLDAQAAYIDARESYTHANMAITEKFWEQLANEPPLYRVGTQLLLEHQQTDVRAERNFDHGKLAKIGQYVAGLTKLSHNLERARRPLPFVALDVTGSVRDLEQRYKSRLAEASIPAERFRGLRAEVGMVQPRKGLDVFETRNITITKESQTVTIKPDAVNLSYQSAAVIDSSIEFLRDDIEHGQLAILSEPVGSVPILTSEPHVTARTVLFGTGRGEAGKIDMGDNNRLLFIGRPAVSHVDVVLGEMRGMHGNTDVIGRISQAVRQLLESL